MKQMNTSSLKKYLFVILLALITLPVLTYGMSSTKSKKAEESYVAVSSAGKFSGFEVGKDFIDDDILRSWSRIDYSWETGLLHVNNEVVYEASFRDLSFADIPNPEKIVYVIASSTEDFEVENFPNLKVLKLYNAKDEDLIRLSYLDNLSLLDLSPTSVSDAGLRHLKDLTNLERLDLGYTSISDTGLGYLKYFINLRVLDLWGTSVTSAGLDKAKLYRALPNCLIDRY